MYGFLRQQFYDNDIVKKLVSPSMESSRVGEFKNALRGRDTIKSE